MESNNISIHDESFVCVTENGDIISNCFTENIFKNKYVGCSHSTLTLILLTTFNTLEVYGKSITIKKMDEVLSITRWHHYFIIYYFDKSLIFISDHKFRTLNSLKNVESYRVVDDCLHVKCKSEYLVYVIEVIGLTIIRFVSSMSTFSTQEHPHIYNKTIINDKFDEIVEVILHSDVFYILDIHSNLYRNDNLIFTDIESTHTYNLDVSLFLFKNGKCSAYDSECPELSNISEYYSDLPTNIKKIYSFFWNALVYEDDLHAVHLQTSEGRFFIFNADTLKIYKSNHLIYIVTSKMQVFVYHILTKQFITEHPMHLAHLYINLGAYI